MAAEMDEEHEMTWLVEDEGEGTDAPALQPESAEDQVIQYTMELQRIRKELADVRKELAAKTVQLMRKEQSAAVEKAEKPQAESQPAAVNQETERQLQLLTGQTIQLEALLSQREEELGEAKRLLVTQKRALREAAALQGEREAADRAAAEASRAVVGQAVEEELERLHAELAAAKTRYELELRKRESELKQLRRELAAVNNEHKQALSAQESNLAEAWQAEMARVQASLGQRVSEYETEVARLRMQLQEAQSSADSTSLLGELAMLNNNKVQVQREFEAFKEMATQATRKNREEVARLLEENAALHSRLANHKTAELTGAGMNLMRPMHPGRTKTVDMSSDQPPPGVSGYSAYAYQAMEAYMPELLRRMERNQKGLVPMLIIGSVLMLMLMVAVVRAAASTHSQHSGALCFLAKLGISIGKGCGPTALQQKDATQEITDMLDRPQRHHDVDVETIGDLPGGQAATGSDDTTLQAVTDTQAAANTTPTGSVAGNSTDAAAGGLTVEPGGGVAEGQSVVTAGGADGQVVPAGVTGATGSDAVTREATKAGRKGGKGAGKGADQGSIVVTPAAAAGTGTPVVTANQTATASAARSIKLGGRRRGE